MMQLISNFLYRKTMFPFMQLHVHYVNLMKKQIICKFQSFEILKQRVVREIIRLLNNLTNYFIFIRFKISNSRYKLHVQKIIV
jgi:hypothetical protein